MKGKGILFWLLSVSAWAAPPGGAGVELVFHTTCGLAPADLPPRVLPRGEPGVVLGGFLAGAPAGAARAWGVILPPSGWTLLVLSRPDVPASRKDLPRLAKTRGLALLGGGLLPPGGPAFPGIRLVRIQGIPLAFLGLPGRGGTGEPGLPKGWKQEDPARVLARLLPRAKEQAKLVVLLAAMDPVGAAALVRGVKGVDLCLVQGGPAADPLPWKAGGTWFVQVPMGGRIQGRVRLSVGEGGLRRVTSEFLPPQGTPDPGLARAGAGLGLPSPLPPGPSRKEGVPKGAAGPSFPRSASNRACRFTLFRAARRAIYGPLKPPEGKEFLLLDLEAENTIPLSDARKEKLPVAYRITDLADHLYLVREGRALHRIHPGCASLPGCLPVRPLLLPRLGSRKRGNLLFLVPRGEKGDLRLRFYDFVHGNFSLPVSAGKTRAGEKPVLPGVRNRFLEMRVYEKKFLREYRGKKAPRGMVFLLVDLRGKSLYSFTRKASLFDPGAGEGGEVRIGTVLDWRDCPRYLRVAAGGGRDFPPLDQEEFGREPRFLPDLFTGGRVVFLVPGGEVSLALKMRFPRAAGPGLDGKVRPRGLILPLREGAAAEGPPGGGKAGTEGPSRPGVSKPAERVRSRFPVLGKMRAGGFEVEYLGTARPGKKKGWRGISPRGPGQEVLGVLVRVTAERKAKMEGLPFKFQLLAGGGFPCPPVFRGEGTVRGLPVWGGREKFSPGEPRSGVLVFSVPLGAKPLTLVFLPRAGEGGKGPAGREEGRALLLFPGPPLPPAGSLARLGGKGFTLSLLGVSRFDARGRPGVVFDFSVKADPREGGCVFRPRDILVLDQAGERRSWGYGRGLSLPPGEFFVPPGRARRFRLRTVLGDRGEKLWLLPGRKASRQVEVPNPWMRRDGDLLSRGGTLEPGPVRRDSRGRWTPPWEAPPLFPEPTPSGLKGAGLEGRRVNEAIRRGALFLIARKEERPLDPDLNEDSLLVLALLHSGELEKHPAFFEKALEYLRTRNLQSVYDAALTLMGLAFADPVENRPRIRAIAQALVDAQSAAGGWSYSEEFVKKVKPLPPASGGGAVQVQGSVPIRGWPGVKTPGPVRLARRVPWREGGGDNSCSQYAVLGLQAAWNAGIRCPGETWERAFRWFLEGHGRGKGWGYGPGGDSTGSMTTAGLAGLAVARFHLGKDSGGGTRALREGVYWLARNFRVDRNPSSTGYHLYYVYGLERAGRLLGKRFFGDREWYPLGARWLVEHQGGDGSWLGFKGNRKTWDTSFALLFLTRATEGLAEAAPVKGKGRLAVVSRALGGVVDFILDASGSMAIPMEEEGGATRLDVARRVVLRALEAGGKDLSIGLRVYGHRYSALDERALRDSELLLPFGPADRPELGKALAGIRCRGKTPLTFSLQAALEDLRRVPGRKKRVVLLTDGLESDRKADPVRAARELARAGVRLDVVGLAVEKAALLERMARAGGGTCFSAGNAGELLASVRSALLGVVPFLVRDEKGGEAGRGNSGESLELPAGPYGVEIFLPRGAVKVKAWVRPGRTTTILVRPGE